MPTIDHPVLLVFGLIAVVIGLLMYRWAGRHDLKGAAIDAAWQVAKSRGKSAITPALQAELDAFKARPSTIDRTKQAAGLAARHFIAQAVSIISYVLILGGLVLSAIALLWK